MKIPLFYVIRVVLFFIFGIIIMFSYRPCQAEPGKVRYQIPSRFLSSTGGKGISSTDTFPVRRYIEPLHNFHHCQTYAAYHQ